MNDLETRKGIVRPGSITGNRDVITTDVMMKWLVEGKIFSAGFGYEHAGVDSDANTKNDLSPEAALVSSHTYDTIIFPILARMSTHTEGGNVPRIACCITKAAKDVAVALKVSGTAMTAIHNHNSRSTNQPTAKVTYTSTASDLTTESNYIMLELAQAADNPTSGSGGLGFNNGAVWDISLLQDPWFLTGGAALLIYPNTNTSATKYSAYFTWAELTLDDLY